MKPLTPADATRSVSPHEVTMAGVPGVRTRTAGPLTVAVVCVALLSTGCGSSHSTPSLYTTTAMSDALMIVACMRSHGAPNMPDPQVFHSGGKTGIVAQWCSSRPTAPISSSTCSPGSLGAPPLPCMQ